jgi:hypothetical protein
VLSQVAFARVLHRRRNKGQIDDDEWEHRLQQPMHFTGPVNFRPYLDPDWYRSGGADEVCLSITFYTLVLPFMPRSSSVDDTGAPSFSSLLSPARFLARARLARVQGQGLLGHPLLHEFHLLRLPERCLRARAAAMTWRAIQAGQGVPPIDSQPGVFKDVAPVVFSNGGASLGSVRLIHAYSQCYSKQRYSAIT